MKLKSITLTFSNPSMGPHETVTQYWLSVENHQPAVDELLESALVNDTAGLSAFASNDRAILNRVEQDVR